MNREDLEIGGIYVNRYTGMRFRLIEFDIDGDLILEILHSDINFKLTFVIDRNGNIHHDVLNTNIEGFLVNFERDIIAELKESLGDIGLGDLV